MATANLLTDDGRAGLDAKQDAAFAALQAHLPGVTPNHLRCVALFANRACHEYSTNRHAQIVYLDGEVLAGRYLVPQAKPAPTCKAIDVPQMIEALSRRRRSWTVKECHVLSAMAGAVALIPEQMASIEAIHTATPDELELWAYGAYQPKQGPTLDARGLDKNRWAHPRHWPGTFAPGELVTWGPKGPKPPPPKTPDPDDLFSFFR